jgi:hypothetical protein
MASDVKMSVFELEKNLGSSLLSVNDTVLSSQGITSFLFEYESGVEYSGGI